MTENFLPGLALFLGLLAFIGLWGAVMFEMVTTLCPRLLMWRKPKVASQWRPKGPNPFSTPDHMFVVSEVRKGWVMGVKMWSGDVCTFQSVLPLSQFFSKYERWDKS